MKTEIINNIINSMASVLNGQQIEKLKEQLYISLNNVDLVKRETSLSVCEEQNHILLKNFLGAKIAAGKTKRTIKAYGSLISYALNDINKNITDINEDDIRLFLYRCRAKGNTTVTMRNTRAYLSTFFGWLRKNKYIASNPIDLVEPIKIEKTIKKPFTDEEVVILKDNCDNLRDRAIIDLLNSSMIRVSELVGLNRDDVVMSERECLVYGKGQKERVVYFDGEAKIHLEEYLKSRKDDNPALFVSKNGRNRLKDTGIRSILSKLSEKTNVNKVHPHRFRRTGATRCLTRGMKLEELQTILGHKDVQTTLIYTDINKNRLKFAYGCLN